ncbi:MAG TPA: ribonuclease J, partial [Clostridia bacterium]|nr:ribonuclease J [Clostridia bacterium]
DFPDEDSPGIDAIIPDITYLTENRDKVRGIFLTHGHEDHIGAIPYVIQDLNVPIYGTALTLALVEHKLIERRIDADTHTVKEGEVVPAGCFKVEFIKVNHSMAGACAFAITTPVGVIYHSGDFKIDATPIDGKPANLQRIAEIGSKGVMLMLGESTNVERKGHSNSERVAGEGLEKWFSSHREKRLIIATFASNNYRVQQILDIAERYGRKVILSGRSMKNIVEMATKVGELTVPKDIIIESPGKLSYSKQVVLATGTQGEPMSALTRMSEGEFGKINIGENDVVILSSSPIPGNEKSVYNVINKLFKRGAEVVYESMTDVHASGHAYAEELKLLLTLVKPKFFIPVHGEYRHLYLHAKMAESVGVNPLNIMIPEIGAVFGVNQKTIKRQSNVPAGSLYVDGEILDEGSNIIRDRRSLAENGFLIVIVSVDMKNGKLLTPPDILIRGMSLSADALENAKTIVQNSIESLNFNDEVIDRSRVTQAIRKALKKKFIKDRHFPMIMPIIFEL